MSRVGRALGGIGATGVVTVLGIGYYYRPIPLDANNQPVDRVSVNASPFKLTDRPDRDIPLAAKVAQQAVIWFGVSLCRLYLHMTGDFTVIPDRNYQNFLQHVANRSEEQPFISVSNHRSLMDDPGVLSSILPYFMNIQPKYVRHSICAQEYCFSDKFGGVIHGIVGLGKVVPIKRGAGISQSLFLDIARIVQSGNWLHVFPEGGIWQLTGLGGRKDPSTKGKLKWGIGRLIAHSPKLPTVIAFYFSGMEKILPHDHDTKKLLHKYPQTGQKVKVLFGEEIQFEDLLAEHEQSNGKLWKFNDDNETVLDRWHNPTEEELNLYSRITLRLEHALDKLGVSLAAIEQSI